MKRRVDSLTQEDFARCPVWRFTDDDTPDETYVSPVQPVPASQVIRCIVGVPIRLADGTTLRAVLGNFDPAQPRLAEHFLTLSLFRSDGAQFHLARYHDFDAAERGPTALASFLGLSVDSAFPISYDLTSVVAGASDSLRGVITAEPRERLTRSELIALAVP